LKRGVPWVIAGALLVIAAWAVATGGVPKWMILSFNLVVFFGILVYFAGPAVIQLLEEKGRDVRHALAEAERQRKEAEEMASRLAAQVEELRHEMDELLARADREGEKDRQEILAQAEEEGKRLRMGAQQEIRHRLEQARQELTRHAVELASRLAEERMSEELTAEDRARLFRENLSRMEER
jgi:F-type H+-transporting ATPase subunit b